MTRNECLRRFPNASEAFLRANCSEDPRPTAVVEHNPCNDSLETALAQNFDSGRILVRVTSVRERFLDEDNLCAKYHIDCCRYAGLIPSDAPDKTKIEISQRKPTNGEEEHVEIVIERIP